MTMNNCDNVTKDVSRAKNEYGAVLYTIINNEYRFLIVEDQDGSRSFFRTASKEEMDIVGFEEVIKAKTGLNAKIDRQFVKFPVEYDCGKSCAFYIGTIDSDDPGLIGNSFLNYVQMQEALTDPKDKEVLEMCNRGLIVQKSGGGSIQDLDCKCIPYIPLNKEEEAEVISMIQEYENSDLYGYIRNCAKMIYYLYGDSHHLEDYHHNDRKYLNELAFHVVLWYPSYLDWLDSQRDPSDRRYQGVGK